jgi:hypothetical protein
MKMKAMMGLILAGGLAAQASAQSFRLGLQGGANVANFNGASNTSNLGSRLGVVGGFFLQLNFGESFAIQPEVLYAQKGATQAVYGATTIDLSYLEFPVLIKFYLPTPGVKPHIFTGGAVSFNTTAQMVSGGTSTALNYVSSSDVGIIGGVGVDIDKLSLSGRYEFGLGAAVPNNTPPLSNSTITFLAGYSFL